MYEAVPMDPTYSGPYPMYMNKQVGSFWHYPDTDFWFQAAQSLVHFANTLQAKDGPKRHFTLTNDHKIRNTVLREFTLKRPRAP